MMLLPTQLLRRTLWRRRVAAARAWQEAERRNCALHNAAVRRILGQAADDVRDPRSGR